MKIKLREKKRKSGGLNCHYLRKIRKRFNYAKVGGGKKDQSSNFKVYDRVRKDWTLIDDAYVIKRGTLELNHMNDEGVNVYKHPECGIEEYKFRFLKIVILERLGIDWAEEVWERIMDRNLKRKTL